MNKKEDNTGCKVCNGELKKLHEFYNDPTGKICIECGCVQQGKEEIVCNRFAENIKHLF